MSRLIYGICTLMVILLSGGCIHTYPVPEGPGKEPGSDPSEIRLRLTVRFPGESPDLPSFPGTGYPGVASAPCRIMVAMTDSRGNTDVRSFNVKAEDIEDNTFTLTLPQTFDALRYTLDVWADHLHPADYTPDWYDTSDLHLIRPLWMPSGSATSRAAGSESAYCAAASGHAGIDLTPYEGEWGYVSDVEVDLTTPLARYRLVADDYQKFLDMTATDRLYGERYYVKVLYTSEIAGGYDLFDDHAVDPLSGVSFDTELPIITIPGVEMAIASDRLIVDPAPGEVHLSVSVYNSAQVLICRTEDIVFKPQRGEMTTVRGNFLTDMITGGLTVDNKWSDEIIIDIN